MNEVKNKKASASSGKKDAPNKPQPDDPQRTTQDVRAVGHDDEVGHETVPMNPQFAVPEQSEKKARPGEISEEAIMQHTKTKKLEDTDYEDGDPRWGTARFNKRMLLEIKLRDTGERFTFDYTDIDEILIGRRDPQTDAAPEIDLEPYGALNKGVSRRHAQIMRRDGALNLIDLGSPNGTFLNGQKLVEHQPRILRDGDDVRLGHLVVRVSFRRGTQA